MRTLKIFELMILIGFIVFLYNSVSFASESKQTKQNKRRVATIDFTKPTVQVINFDEPLEIIVIKSNNKGVSK